MTKDIVEKIKEQYSIGTFAVIKYEKNKPILGKIRDVRWVESAKSCRMEFQIKYHNSTFIIDIYDDKMLNNICTVLESKEKIIDYYLQQNFKKDSFVTLKFDTSTPLLIQDIVYIENCNPVNWNNVYILTTINSAKYLDIKIPNEKLLALIPIDDCEIETDYPNSASSLFEN